MDWHPIQGLPQNLLHAAWDWLLANHWISSWKKDRWSLYCFSLHDICRFVLFQFIYAKQTSITKYHKISPFCIHFMTKSTPQLFRSITVIAFNSIVSKAEIINTTAGCSREKLKSYSKFL